MSRFHDFDYVELIGETLDIEIPVGSRGYVVESFPENEHYYIEFLDEDGELIDLATASADHLALIEAYQEAMKIPA